MSAAQSSELDQVASAVLDGKHADARRVLNDGIERARAAEDCALQARLLGRLASIRSLDRPLRDVASIQQDHRDALVSLAERAVTEDGADIIVLAGAPLAGLARQVHGLLPVPVVDGVSSAVRHAETLVALAPTKARAGSLAPPPVKPNAGLSPQLQALLAGR